MKEIYELKKSGKTLEEIHDLIYPKRHVSTISRKLRAYCIVEGLEMPKEKPGRKSILLKIRSIFEEEPERDQTYKDYLLK